VDERDARWVCSFVTAIAASTRLLSNEEADLIVFAVRCVEATSTTRSYRPENNFCNIGCVSNQVVVQKVLYALHRKYLSSFEDASAQSTGTNLIFMTRSGETEELLDIAESGIVVPDLSCGLEEKGGHVGPRMRPSRTVSARVVGVNIYFF
jgi:hypothetical protein